MIEEKSGLEILNELRATGRSFKISSVNGNVHIAEDDLAPFARPVLDSFYDPAAEFVYDLEQLEKAPISETFATEFPLF